MTNESVCKGLEAKARPQVASASSRSPSNAVGLIEEDVNVKERAAIFSCKPTTAANATTKLQSLPLQKQLSVTSSSTAKSPATAMTSNDVGGNASSTATSHNASTAAAEISPPHNKIKNIAAFFEQHKS